MAFRHVQSLLHGPRLTKKIRAMHMNVLFYRCINEPHLDPLPSEWYEKAFPRLIKLTHLLKDLDFVEGRLVHINDNHVVNNEHLKQNMHCFKSLGRAFLGCPTMQQPLKKNMMASFANAAFTSIGREPISVNSLTKVCNILNISAQQRKLVRLAICPQVTQHQIWTGALEEILNRLKSEMDSMDNGCVNKGTRMGQQIVVNCLKFLDNAISYDPDSTSWMRLAPKKDTETQSSDKWEDVLEMFNDVINCLKNESEFQFYVTKLESMREGLLQIKDVLINKNIGYKECRHQQSLVQKKLTKTLGHSSRCLFTLLLYYLCGSVGDIELEICSGLSGDCGGNTFYLCIGKILTSNEEKMVWRGVKQLNRAIGLFKYVWETAEMKDVLEMEGHLWCVGAENRSITYRGNTFFMHRVSL